jgi:hypothetical protein
MQDSEAEVSARYEARVEAVWHMVKVAERKTQAEELKHKAEKLKDNAELLKHSAEWLKQTLKG